LTGKADEQVQAKNYQAVYGDNIQDQQIVASFDYEGKQGHHRRQSKEVNPFFLSFGHIRFQYSVGAAFSRDKLKSEESESRRQNPE
jgi:hypothetical protein